MPDLKDLLGGGKVLLSAAARDVVHNVAPNLGRALDSPLGQVAQREIARRVLGDPGAPADQVSARLEAPDAETLKQLTDAQAEVMRGFQEAQVDLQRIAAGDRASARQAHKDSRFVMALAGTIIAGFFAVLGTLMFVAPPDGMREVLIALIGLLGGAVSSVTQFFFGSSQGSKDKTALMAGRG